MGSRIRTIGSRYRLDSLAGRGASGAVYRAVDLETGAAVAVKVLTATEPLARARFAKEAELLRSLGHPNIVRYLAHGQSGAEDYLVMEWVSGRRLRERFRDGRLTESETLTLGARLAEAIVYLNRQQIVHRDIKPENIILVDGNLDRAMLVDLGVASGANLTNNLTRTGVLLGTPRYMAPEQIRAPKRVDSRADVFSLGCVLFECLTGVSAFDGDDIASLLTNILLEKARRVSALQSVTPRLDDLIAALQARRPEDRPSPTHEEPFLNLFSEAEAPPTLADAGEVAQVTSGQRLRDTHVSIKREEPSISQQWQAPEVFVGRTHELEMLRDVLTGHGCTVLWGPAGIGKTRLAAEFAKRLARPTLVVEGCASVDATLEKLRVSKNNATAFWAAQEEALVVLDGAEPCIDALLAEVLAWQKQAPHVRFLCVSRRAPKHGTVPFVPLGGLDEESSAELLALHLESYAQTGVKSASASSHMLAALEGNPFAIRLAAAHLSLSVASQRAPESKAVQLDDAISMQMRDAIATSWHLLGEVPRAILAACAGFGSGVSVAILATVFPSIPQWVIIDTIETLLRHSLLVSFSGEAGARFRLSFAVGAFVRAKVPKQVENAERRIEAIVLEAATACAQAFTDTGHPEALAQLADDAVDLERAFERSVAEGNAAMACTCVLALAPVWESRRSLSNVLDHIERVLRLTHEVTPDVLRVRQVRARVCSRLTQFAEAQSELSSVLTYARGTKDSAWIQHAWVDLGVSFHESGDVRQARVCYEAVVRECDGAGSRAEARALANLAALHHDESDGVHARELYVRAAAQLEALGDARQCGICIGNLAVLESEAGRSVEAKRRFREAVERLTHVGDGRLLGITLGNFGMFALEQGDLELAIRLLHDAKSHNALAGDGRSEALTLARLGVAFALAHEDEESARALRRAEKLAVHTDALTRHAVDAMCWVIHIAQTKTLEHPSSAELASLRREYLRLVSVDPVLGVAPSVRSDDVRAALRLAARLDPKGQMHKGITS